MNKFLVDIVPNNKGKGNLKHLIKKIKGKDFKTTTIL